MVGGGLMKKQTRLLSQRRQRLAFRNEFQRDAVVAIAPARRRRPVFEHVALMSAAARAMILGARHADFIVRVRAEVLFEERLKKARPARAAFILCVGGKQRQKARGANERALALLMIQRTRARIFRVRFEQHCILLARKQSPPFFAGLLEFRHGFAAVAGNKSFLRHLGFLFGPRACRGNVSHDKEREQ